MLLMIRSLQSRPQGQEKENRVLGTDVKQTASEISASIEKPLLSTRIQNFFRLKIPLYDMREKEFSNCPQTESTCWEF
jgi:hypothetical protein